MNDELNKLKEEAERALTCLYIAASKPVADDVNEKVRAYILELESRVMPPISETLKHAKEGIENLKGEYEKL